MLVSFFFLLKISVAEAKIDCDELDVDENCIRELYGFKPTSLLMLMQTVTGVIIALLLPCLNCAVEHASRRRSFAIITGTIMIAWLYAASFLIALDIWFTFSVGFAIYGATFFLHTMVMHTYVPDLDFDTGTLVTYFMTFKKARVIAFILTVLSFVGVNVYYSIFTDEDGINFEIGVTRTFFVISATFQLILLFFAFKGFNTRPSESEGNSESVSSIPTVQEMKIIGTMIYNEYRPLFWYLVALTILTNVRMVVPGVAVTYVVVVETDFLYAGIGIAISAINVAIGYYGNVVIAKRFGVLESVKVITALWIVGILFIGFFLTGPDQIVMYLVANGILGLLLGWTSPSVHALHVVLLPKGKETLITGFYIFVSAGCSWTIPLMFTILNEIGLRISQITMLGAIPLLMSLIALVMVGPLDLATKKIQEKEKNEPLIVMKEKTLMASTTYKDLYFLFPSVASMTYIYEISIYHLLEDTCPGLLTTTSSGEL